MPTPSQPHLDPAKLVWGTQFIGLPDGVSGYKQLAQSPDGQQHQEYDSEWQTNARRFVACWNACQGISTESLEQNGAAGMEHVLQVVREADGLRAERDALQAKLDELQRQEPVAYSVGNTLKWHEGKGMTNAQLYAAPKALEPLTDDFLQSNDYHLLHRFIETTEDNEGYDITKTEIKRLADLGVVQSHGFGRYSVTMFGYWVHERFWEQNPSLPLKTNSDRDAEAAHGITKGTP